MSDHQYNKEKEEYQDLLVHIFCYSLFMNVCKLIKKVNIWVRKTFVLVRREIEILLGIRVDNNHRKCNTLTSLICSKSRMAVAID